MVLNPQVVVVNPQAVVSNPHSAVGNLQSVMVNLLAVVPNAQAVVVTCGLNTEVSRVNITACSSPTTLCGFRQMLVD